MGSMSRMGACDRFIEEFNDDYVKYFDMADKLGPVVKWEGLCEVHESVWYGVEIRHAGDDSRGELLFSDWGEIFDPDFYDIDSIKDIVGPDAEKRLEEANL